MGDITNITINLPASLYGTFHEAVTRQAISEEEACRRIVRGLSGLTVADLRSLSEPPREYSNRDLEIGLEWRYVDRLSEVTQQSLITISGIFRRILYAHLITRKVHFVSRNEKEFRLELTQSHFEFAEDFERDGPSPLLSRQHREKS